jgi:hypothetical protein
MIATVDHWATSTNPSTTQTGNAMTNDVARRTGASARLRSGSAAPGPVIDHLRVRTVTSVSVRQAMTVHEEIAMVSSTRQRDQERVGREAGAPAPAVTVRLAFDVDG